MKRILAAVLLCSVFLVQCKKDDTKASTATATAANLNNRAVGASANEFLSGAKYTAINVQLQYMPGFAPDAAALNNLTAFLNTLVNKPAGITISQTPIAASGKSVFTLEDINAREVASRTEFTSGSTLSVYVLYVDAPFSTANVLGAAYRNTSLVVFGPTITSNSGGLNQPPRAKLETTLLEHEFGHLLGLVNLGSPMVTGHEDATHLNHCNNSNCLMYYSVQTTVIGGMLMNNPVPVLDANCKADLTANGGK